MAGVSADVLLIEKRWLFGIDSPSFKTHSTTAITGDVTEFARLEAHAKERLLPVVMFPNGIIWNSIRIPVGAGTVCEVGKTI